MKHGIRPVLNLHADNKNERAKNKMEANIYIYSIFCGFINIILLVLLFG